MKGQDQGLLWGIWGWLGNLGKISHKLDIAMCQANGFLDAIVVDTVDDGTLAMEYLRANKVGQAVFLCIDKITSQLKGTWEKYSQPY